MASHTAIALVLFLFALNVDLIATEDKSTVIPNVSSPTTSTLAVSVTSVQSSAATEVSKSAVSSKQDTTEKFKNEPLSRKLSSEVSSPPNLPKTTKIAPVLPSVAKDRMYYTDIIIGGGGGNRSGWAPEYLSSNHSQSHVNYCAANAIYQSAEICKRGYPKIINQNWYQSTMCLNRYVTARKECFSSRNHDLSNWDECAKWYAPNLFNVNLSNAKEPERMKHLNCLINDLQTVQLPGCYQSCKGVDPAVDVQADWKFCSEAAAKTFSDCYFISSTKIRLNER